MKGLRINPQMLNWSIQRVGIKLPALEKSFPQFNKWLNQEKYPSYKQLEEFAKKVRLPVGYFFLTNPPRFDLDIPFFRTLDDGMVQDPSPELIDSFHILHRRQSWLRDYMVQNDYEKLDFIASEKDNPDAKDIANKMRERLGLEENWATKHANWENAFRALLIQCEEIGINVVINGVVENNTSRKLNVDEFSGFVLADDYAPFLFINNSESKAAQIFTLAHELAHLWIGESAIFDLHELKASAHKSETFCNKIAAEFLVQAENLKKRFKEQIDAEDAIQNLAKIYKVSGIVIARRLFDSRVISYDDFLDFYHAYLKKYQSIRKKPAGGDYYENQNNRVGKTFMKKEV